MDQAQARALLAGERARLQRLLQAETGKPEMAQLGDEVDDADRRNAEETGMEVDRLLRARWSGAPAGRGPAGRRQLRPFGPQRPADPRRAAGGGPAGRTDRPGGGCTPARGARGGRQRGRVDVAGHAFEVLADADITPEEEQASEEDDDEPAPEPILGIHIERNDRTR